MLILAIIISISVLILVHELGHFWTAKMFGAKVEEFGLGFPPRLFSKKIGGTVYSINVLPFGGFVKIHKEDEKTESDEVGLTDLALWKRAVVLSAGVFMNVVLAFAVISAVFMVGSPQYVLVAEVLENSPAASAGLAPGDVILESRREINGELSALQEPVTAESFISFVGANPEAPLTLVVQRDGRLEEFVVFGRAIPPPGEGHLGIMLTDIGFPRLPVLASIAEGAKIVYFSLGVIAVGFYNFFTGLLVDPKVIETIAGPVGIFTLAAHAGDLGLVYLFQLMAFISLNLAILNLIPFPALDGGRLLFLAFEKLKGSPISLKIQASVNAAGFALLIMLLIAVTIKDIKGLF